MEASFWSMKMIRLVTALKEINTKWSNCNKINIIQRKKRQKNTKFFINTSLNDTVTKTLIKFSREIQFSLLSRFINVVLSYSKTTEAKERVKIEMKIKQRGCQVKRLIDKG